MHRILRKLRNSKRSFSSCAVHVEFIFIIVEKNKYILIQLQKNIVILFWIYITCYLLYTFYFTVCRSSKRPAITCLNLVWRFAGISSDQHGPPVSWIVSYWTLISVFLDCLHSLSLGKLLSKIKKALHKVYLFFIILFHVFV